MRQRYIVTLSDEERQRLRTLIACGKGPARKLMHARVLLKAERRGGKPGWKHATIANGLEVGTSTVERVCQRFVEEGLEAALIPHPSKRQYRRKLDGGAEAHLIALACSEAPQGRTRWTLRLLAERMVALEYVDTVSHETVREVLKKTTSSRG